MKKVISVMLSVVIFVSCLCLSSFATEPSTKTEALINKIEQTKSIGVMLDDSLTENDYVSITDLTVMFKIHNDGSILSNMKYAATAKVQGFKTRAIFGENNILYATSLRCYIDINEFLEIKTTDMSLTATALDKLLDYLTADFYESLTLTYAGERNIKGYGDVYVERFGTKAEFYYDGDVLLGFKTVGLDTDSFYLTFETKDVLPDYVNGIVSGIDDSTFEKPTGFYINVTPLVKFVYNLVSSMKS